MLSILVSGCAHKACSGTPPLPGAKLRAYVGTYTGAKSKGIYTFTFDTATGEVGPLELAAPALNPSFLAIHPDRQHLYCVGDMTNAAGKKVGAVSAFVIEPDGKLTLLNQVTTVGAGPCHLTVDKTGCMVLAANYGGGSVVSFPIKADGSIGEHTSFVQHIGRSVTPRQAQPNAHSVNISQDNRFAFVADLGLDQVLIYKLDPAKATFAAHEPPFVKVPPGSGPRHFCFHPNGKFAYVINEISLTVTAFRFDAVHGTLTEMQTLSTLPAADGPGPKAGWSTAEIVAHPGGKFLYCSNRGHDTIAVFAIADDGTLSLVQNAAAEVKVPRNFALDPTGQWLFTEGQKSDDIALFRVDAATGKLTFTSKKLEIGSPVCLKFLPQR
jgi:6-phosphogluconolactonase